MKKEEFLCECRKIIKDVGYRLICTNLIKGKGEFHSKKPDFLAVYEKNSIFLIGEIKTPDEPPESSSWRQSQKSDTSDFIKIRQLIRELERVNRIKKEIGGHVIILLGQTIDYLRCFGQTYTLLDNSIDLNRYFVRFAYCVPLSQLRNVEDAMDITGINLVRKLQSNSVDYCHNPIIFIYEVPYRSSYSYFSCSQVFKVNIFEHLNRLESLFMC